jgi:hypothetical protein
MKIYENPNLLAELALRVDVIRALECLGYCPSGLSDLQPALNEITATIKDVVNLDGRKKEMF